MTAIFDDHRMLAVDYDTLSRSLDEWARSIPNRPALKPDPVLWEAFSEDRVLHPAPVSLPMDVELGRCSECEKLIRPKGTRADRFPGTVGSGSKGMCQWCYRTSRSAS